MVGSASQANSLSKEDIIQPRGIKRLRTMSQGHCYNSAPASNFQCYNSVIINENTVWNWKEILNVQAECVGLVAFSIHDILNTFCEIVLVPQVFLFEQASLSKTKTFIHGLALIPGI